MSLKSIRTIFLSVLLGTSFVATAATDTFTINNFISSDTIPPSVPTNLVATPIASTQIDLTWSSSTDNHIVSGYQVFRDSVQIATTTSLSYSDTGLIASTTYTYFLTAFDMTGNISASSSPVSTTTLDTPVITPDDEEATTTSVYGSKRTSFEIVRLEIIPDMYSAILRYETKAYIRPVTRWGRSFSYELGSIGGVAYKKVHETKITGLNPNTRYYFSIEGEDSSGRTGVLTESTFTTLPPVDVFPPGNVIGLSAILDGNDIILSWDNPQDLDFARVRVMRSDQFFPSDTVDGWLVYEGKENSVHDLGIAIPGTRQYYTVFAYDELGNISSGAVVSIATTDGDEIIIDETTNPLNLVFSDFNFVQDDEILMPQDEKTVVIDGTKALTIELPYDRVPEHLKTILVSLTNKDKKSFSFLLRINEGKTAYVATFAPLGISGRFPISITIFDYKTSQIGFIKGELISQIAYLKTPKNTKQTFIGYVLETFSGSKTVTLTAALSFMLLLLLFFTRMYTQRQNT